MGLDVEICYKNDGEYFGYYGTDGAFLGRLFSEKELNDCGCQKEISAKDLRSVMLEFVKETMEGFSKDYSLFSINKKHTLYTSTKDEYVYRMMALDKTIQRLMQLAKIDDNTIFIIDFNC